MPFQQPKFIINRFLNSKGVKKSERYKKKREIEKQKQRAKLGSSTSY